MKGTLNKYIYNIEKTAGTLYQIIIKKNKTAQQSWGVFKIPLEKVIK